MNFTTVRYTNRFAIQISATIFPCIKTFIATNFVHYTQYKFLTIQQTNAYSIERNALNVVCGTIQWIDYPIESFTAFIIRPFFGYEPRFG
ncbi:hypothetical protein SDC9_181717 [bioreactor metagenome]|uniref:Uncharacterized protein n=1 Tax=bioreactor metagenome TaxID=1076179 RepID=A0A645HDQ1_9ZZZZ